MSSATVSVGSTREVVEARRSGHGGSLSLLALPTLLFVGYAIHPDLPEDTASALVDVAGGRGRFVGAKLLVAVGALGLVPVVAAIARRVMASGRARGLAAVGAALAIVGTTANALSQVVFGYLFWFATAAGVSPEAGVEVVSASEDGGLATLPISFLSVPLFAVGLLLLAAALWRCGRVPRWVPVLLAAGNVLAGAIGVGPLMLIAGALTTAALWGALTTLSEEGPAL